MIVFRKTPREEMYRAHGLEAAPESEAPKRHRNVREVLDLGTISYISFRGRQYGVPPLPWPAGEAMLDAYLTVREFEGDLRREDLRPYFEAVERLADLVWANLRPLGTFRRLLKATGLLANPIRDATEADVGALAVFFLGRRTKSSGIGLRVPAPPLPTCSPISPSSPGSSPPGSGRTVIRSLSGISSTG